VFRDTQVLGFGAWLVTRVARFSTWVTLAMIQLVFLS